MASEPVGVEQPIRFGEGFELDLRPRRLRRGSHVLKLERIPFEILLLLAGTRLLPGIKSFPEFGARVFSWIPTTVSGVQSETRLNDFFHDACFL